MLQFHIPLWQSSVYKAKLRNDFLFKKRKQEKGFPKSVGRCMLRASSENLEPYFSPKDSGDR